MSDKPHALSTLPPTPPAEPDYDTICSAVMATARGRWFLSEYARRNRHTDTSQVLAAIERIEAVIAGDRVHHVKQEVRIELLEMVRAIAQTRADVAESRANALPLRAAAQPATESRPDIAGAAERLRDIAWTMRTCGVELATSGQIEQLAETILAATSLREESGDRAQKLGEVLHYLEHRIDRMLDTHLEAARGETGRVVPEDSRSTPHQPAVNGHDTGAGGAAVQALAPESALLAEAVSKTPPLDAAAPKTSMATEAAGVTGTTAFIESAAATEAGAAAEPATATEAVPATDAAGPTIAADAEPVMAPEPPALDRAETRTTTFDVAELRVEPVELELDPLIVVPVGIVDREEVAPPAPPVNSIASAVAPVAPQDNVPASTGDPVLDDAFALPEAPAAAAPEPEVNTEPSFVAIDIEPLVVIPIGARDVSNEPPPSVDASVDTSVERPHVIDAEPMAASHVAVDLTEAVTTSHPTVDHALDQELAEPPPAVDMQTAVPEFQVVLFDLDTLFTESMARAAEEAAPASTVVVPDPIPVATEPSDRVVADVSAPVLDRAPDAVETTDPEPEALALAASDPMPAEAPPLSSAVEAPAPVAHAMFESEPADPVVPQLGDMQTEPVAAVSQGIAPPAPETVTLVPPAPVPDVEPLPKSEPEFLSKSEVTKAVETEAASALQPDTPVLVPDIPAPPAAEPEVTTAVEPDVTPTLEFEAAPAQGPGVSALQASEPDVPAASEPAPETVAGAEPEQPAATAQADSVGMQFDEDLLALTDPSPGHGASNAAADVIAPPAKRRTAIVPASALAPAPEPASEPPPESNVLSSARETAILTPPEFSEKPADRRPVPSMWEPLAHAPMRPQGEREDAPADFLLQQVARNEMPIQPAPVASTQLAAGQMEIENDLFAAPAEAGPLPQVATAAMAEAAPDPVAAATLAEPKALLFPQPVVSAAPARAAAKPMPRHVADNPLAALMAMTDEERIAVFT